MVRLVQFLLLSLPLIGAYAIFTLGIVVIYRASKVLNLAHGAMAMIPAYLVHSMVGTGLPIIPALLLGIVAGAALSSLGRQPTPHVEGRGHSPPPSSRDVTHRETPP